MIFTYRSNILNVHAFTLDICCALSMTNKIGRKDCISCQPVKACGITDLASAAWNRVCM